MIETAVAHLQSLGFNASATPLKKGFTVKVRTTKGWVYEKFNPTPETLVEALNAWAANHAPGE